MRGSKTSLLNNVQVSLNCTSGYCSSIFLHTQRKKKKKLTTHTGHLGSHFDLQLKTFGTEEDNPHLQTLHPTSLNSGIIPLNSSFAFCLRSTGILMSSPQDLKANHIVCPSVFSKRLCGAAREMCRLSFIITDR